MVAIAKNDELSGLEKLWYVVGNICTLGLYFTLKIIIKKAILEANRGW